MELFVHHCKHWRGKGVGEAKHYARIRSKFCLTIPINTVLSIGLACHCLRLKDRRQSAFELKLLIKIINVEFDFLKWHIVIMSFVDRR